MPELTSKLIEMHQRVVIDMQTRLNALTEREHKLEQLCKEYRELLQAWDSPPLHTTGLHAYGEQYQAAEKRNNEFFGEQENKS